MIDIGSKMKDKDGNIGILVGYIEGVKPVIMYANECKIYMSVNLLEEVE